MRSHRATQFAKKHVGPRTTVLSQKKAPGGEGFEVREETSKKAGPRLSKRACRTCLRC